MAITGLWLPISLNRSASVATDWRVIWGVALVHEGMGECLNVCNPITGMEPCTAKIRKTMDKSCRVYGNFHSDNRAVKCGTPGLYRSRKSILKSGTWSHRMPEWTMLINPAQPLQTENGQWRPRKSLNR